MTLGRPLSTTSADSTCRTTGACAPQAATAFDDAMFTCGGEEDLACGLTHDFQRFQPCRKIPVNSCKSL